jgi:hypothetical protein
MLTFSCWRWGGLFEPIYVNRLRAALDRHVRIEHELVCVTDDTVGIDGDVRIVAMPDTYKDTPRCRRRMQQYDREFAAQLGTRIVTIDLDVVIVDDITPIVDRPEPIVCWTVEHAGVFSGSFVMADAGALHQAWLPFRNDPVGYPRRLLPNGVASDQAMLNVYLRGRPIHSWTEADGFVTYYGAGYEALEHFGVGPTRRNLPHGARIVVLGSADKSVMDEGRYPWVVEHWGAPIVAKAVA